MHSSNKIIRSKCYCKMRFTLGVCDILKSKEWLIIKCVDNVAGTTLRGFYIFKGKGILENL
jgi:hypothetical protein